MLRAISNLMANNPIGQFSRIIKMLVPWMMNESNTKMPLPSKLTLISIKINLQINPK